MTALLKNACSSSSLNGPTLNVVSTSHFDAFFSIHASQRLALKRVAGPTFTFHSTYLLLTYPPHHFSSRGPAHCLYRSFLSSKSKPYCLMGASLNSIYRPIRLARALYPPPLTTLQALDRDPCTLPNLNLIHKSKLRHSIPTHLLRSVHHHQIWIIMSLHPD